MRHSLKVIMVKGPARVFVKGACHVLGSDVSGQTVKVRAGKALPFEPSNKWCRLQARLGYGARIWCADPKQAGTSMWHSVAEQVSALTACKKTTTTVMLVGDTDTGKSTLAIYLANMAISHGLVPIVIDGDIGQGDLAPPTAIGAAVLSKQVVDLRDINTNNNKLFEFVGTTSPIGFEGLIAEKLKSILDRTGPLADICIVNTDGYVRNSGLRYKAMIAEKLQPDVIICLGGDVFLLLLDRFKIKSCHILHASPSSQAYKSRLERLSRRLDQFLRYVSNRSYIVNLSQVKFDYMNKLFLPSDLFQPHIEQLEPENMTGMFVGLGSNGNVVGFGVITNVSPGNGTLQIQTNISSFDTIHLSNVRLSSDRIMEVRIT